VTVAAHDRALRIAAEVVRRANREHPADAVLRLELKKQRALSAADARRAADFTFCFYRWFGWLDQREDIEDNVSAASSLQEKFDSDPTRFGDEDFYRRSIPEWVHREVAVSLAWARSLQGKPRLWLRARPGQGGNLAARLGDCAIVEGGHLRDIVEYRGSLDLFRSPEFQSGEFELQDISSQFVGLLCDPKAGETWWDACAGEGGKILHLSDLMRNQGLIWASDRAAWRLKRLKLRAARAKVFNYRAVSWDGGARLPTRVKFDGVLLDAPCSGIGTWQRNPHARWTTTLNDVRELAVLQGELLRHAAGAVRPGGKLVYSVCTLTHAETTEVAEMFAREFPHFQPLLLPNPLKPGDPARAQQWFWPQECGGSGMFVAAWRREA